MTTKETLIREYFELKTQFDMNAGNDVQKYDNYLTRADIYCYTKKYKVYELEEMVEDMKNRLERQASEKRKEEYFNSEEGNNYKEELTAQLDAIRDEHDVHVKTTTSKINNLIKRTLGGRFGVAVSSGYKMVIVNIGIMKDDRDFVFGHSFEVRYAEEIKYIDGEWKNAFDFTMNYGTMGSFSLDTDIDRVAYVTGMGKFIGDEALKNELKYILSLFIGRENELTKKYDETNNKLNNPIF